MTQANISKHLRIMYDAHLLHRKRDGTSIYYSIDDEVIFPLCELICDKLNRDQQSVAAIEFSI